MWAALIFITVCAVVYAIGLSIYVDALKLELARLESEAADTELHDDCTAETLEARTNYLLYMQHAYTELLDQHEALQREHMRQQVQA